MFTSLLITTEKIDEVSLARERTIGPEEGAVIVFLGVVRESEGAQKIAGIDYEAFGPMVKSEFAKIFHEAGERWPINAIRLVHRIGFVAVKEPSLWVEVTAGHRGEAFAACQYLIDEMKKRVPIWKNPRPVS